MGPIARQPSVCENGYRRRICARQFRQLPGEVHRLFCTQFVNLLADINHPPRHVHEVGQEDFVLAVLGAV